MRTFTAKKAEPVSRIEGVQDGAAGLLTKLVFWRAKRRFGHVPMSTRIRAYDPSLLLLAERMSKYTATAVTISAKLKELAQLKVAAMVGCRF